MPSHVEVKFDLQSQEVRESVKLVVPIQSDLGSPENKKAWQILQSSIRVSLSYCEMVDVWTMLKEIIGHVTTGDKYDKTR